MLGRSWTRNHEVNETTSKEWFVRDYSWSAQSNSGTPTPVNFKYRWSRKTIRSNKKKTKARIRSSVFEKPNWFKACSECSSNRFNEHLKEKIGFWDCRHKSKKNSDDKRRRFRKCSYNHETKKRSGRTVCKCNTLDTTKSRFFWACQEKEEIEDGCTTVAL